MAAPRKAYNFERQVSSPAGTNQLYINFYQRGPDWTVTISGPLVGRIELFAADFEEITTLHLRYQGYTLWTPEEKISAYAMAHMAGFLSDEDGMQWKK